MMHQTDITIIGAGPVGLFAIFQAGMLKMRCHVVDALDFAGGQCAALYPEKPIYDIAGYPQIEAQELVQKLEVQAAPFEPVYHFGQRVEKIRSIDGEWHVTTSTGTEIQSKAVVIAAGCGAFGPNRPPLEGLDAFEAASTAGQGIHYMVGRRSDFAGKRVVIAGGGDSAVDWALSLAPVAALISVVHRRDKFRAAPDSVDKLRQLAAEGVIELVVPYQLAGLEGKQGVLSGVRVKQLNGEERVLQADALLPFYGLSMELGPIAQWGLNIDRNHIAVDPTTFESSQKAIYAIGDIATYPGKLKLILCGFSEAAMAMHAIYGLVHPNEALHFEYSTTKGVPA